MITSSYKILENYKGYDICCVNFANFNSRWIGIVVNGELSVLSFATIRGAKNIIDTLVKTTPKY